MSHRILLVDDDESLRRVTSYHLEQSGYEVISTANAQEARKALEGEGCDLVITDVRMPGLSGLELLAEIKRRWPELGVVVVTAHGSVEDAVEAMRAGASDYVLKPFEHQALLLSVEKALRLSSLVQENRRLRVLADEQLGFDNLIGRSPAMQKVLESMALVASRDVTVLLLGESGTGKELLARAIHMASPRKDGPFVAVNTGALPEGLVDSELFGHKRGSFTGAVADRQGRFEMASGGTIFLDEIGDLRLELQVKLLRVLQEAQVDPVGGTGPVDVDVRVVAATHRNLESMVASGEFREDLFYRLNVVPLRLPPLRERREDIPLLARHFAARIASRQGQEAPRFDASVFECLIRHPWPGNVRELENVVERLLVLRPSGPLTAEDLPEELRVGKPGGADWLGQLPEDGIVLDDVEKEILSRGLERCEGNQSQTARYLGISRNTLLYRMEKHGLKGD